MDASSPPLLRCRALQIGYGREPLLPPIDLEIGEGQFWAVIGRNGSGKTTWFRTVLGLLPALGGQVEQPRGPVRLAYVPQRTGFDGIWPVRARDVVAMGRERGWSFLRPAAQAVDVDEALAAVGAADLAEQRFRDLSEGQKQRVLLARVVVGGAQVALLDEPTAAMDVVAEREALGLLDALRHRFGTTVVVVSHFLGVAQEHADRVVLFDQLAAQVVVGSAEEVFAHEVFQQRYGDARCSHE